MQVLIISKARRHAIFIPDILLKSKVQLTSLLPTSFRKGKKPTGNFDSFSTTLYSPTFVSSLNLCNIHGTVQISCQGCWNNWDRLHRGILQNICHSKRSPAKIKVEIIQVFCENNVSSNSEQFRKIQRFFTAQTLLQTLEEGKKKQLNTLHHFHMIIMIQDVLHQALRSFLTATLAVGTIQKAINPVLQKSLLY